MATAFDKPPSIPIALTRAKPVILLASSKTSDSFNLIPNSFSAAKTPFACSFSSFLKLLPVTIANLAMLPTASSDNPSNARDSAAPSLISLPKAIAVPPKALFKDITAFFCSFIVIPVRPAALLDSCISFLNSLASDLDILRPRAISVVDWSAFLNWSNSLPAKLNKRPAPNPATSKFLTIFVVTVLIF